METVGNLLAHTFHLVVKKGFVKGVENPTKKLLRNNLEENNSNFQKKKKHCLTDRGYPQTLTESLLSEIKFTTGTLNS